jgi:isovaleryl-CoA dehydrogenase
VTAFLVEKGMKGFSTAQKLDKLGMRGSHTGELVFQNVEVPAAERAGRSLNKGCQGADERTRLPSALVLDGRAARHHAGSDGQRDSLHPRPQAVRPEHRQFQLIQGKVADMYTVLQSSARLRLPGGRRTSMRWVPSTCARCAKTAPSVIFWTAEKATWMASDGMQIFGGNGYINEYPLGRLWRDAKLYEIGAGTSEIRRMLIGRELFAETM